MLIGAYVRRMRNEQRRVFETTRIAVNHGFAGESKSFDEVFPESKPAEPVAAGDESAERWW